MNRGDEVVDAELAFEIDQLPGDFRGRTDQKTVLDQLVEFVIEIVAGRHDLVLAPFPVGLVFDLQIRPSQADRLLACARDKYLAPHWQFSRERLTTVLQ